MRTLGTLVVRLSGLLVAICFVNAATTKADEFATAKPIPKVQVEPLPHHQAGFRFGGRELTRYHFDPADRRPFLFPLNGPHGTSLTRMGHPHDPISHSHHNSIWIAHHSVDGVNFWGDAGKNLGRIVPQRIEEYVDGDDAASLLAVHHWINESTGETLLVEHRRIEVRPLTEGESLTIIDLQLAPPRRPIIVDKTPFGLVGVRMRKTIGVHDGGGQIRNSAGGVGEKPTADNPGVFWKPAKWCDYSGLVADGVVEGITLFDHPQNPNHPTVFHVRDDGWMGSSLTFDAARTIEPNAPLRLRYGLYAHSGLPSIAAIDRVWQNFAELPFAERLERRKPNSPPAVPASSKSAK